MDARKHIIQKIANALARKGKRNVILEMSPFERFQHMLAQQGPLPEYFQDILDVTVLLVFESGVVSDDEFGNDESDALWPIRRDRYLLECDFHKQQTRRMGPAGTDGWRSYDREELLSNQDGARSVRSLGLANRLIAKEMAMRFLGPQVLLCSKSPRRYELLAGEFGKQQIEHYERADSPEFERNNAKDEADLLSMLVEVTADKLVSSLKARTNDGISDAGIRVAVSSDLVVTVPGSGGDNSILILDKPEKDATTAHGTAIERARDYLNNHLSGRTQTVWTCTVFAGGEAGATPSFDVSEDFWARIRACKLPTIVTDKSGSRFAIKKLDSNRLSVVVLFVASDVAFRQLEPREIEEYLASGEWRGKSGGYAIQGCGAYFVETLVGSYTNVMGLPIEHVSAVLRSGYSISDEVKYVLKSAIEADSRASTTQPIFEAKVKEMFEGT